MVSVRRDDFLNTAGLTLGMSTSASTETGHKVVSLVAMPRKKV